ncbi:MAG: DUF4340 domain-containing protein [Phycisphaeraceae bacterium]|nr:DUF4340 domain-containing protein [Phycisphaeraceae bacterium]
MNYKTTIALLFLVLCAGTYFAFFGTNDSTTTSNSSASGLATEETPLFKTSELSTESVTSVAIERQGMRLVLYKSGTDWIQISPVRFPLNDWSVQRIVQNFAGLRANQTLKPNDKTRPALDTLGLAPPAGSVTVTTSENKSFSIRVGRTAPGGRVFVMVGEDPNVYVVSDDIQKSAISEDVNNWRRTRLNSPAEGQLDRVELTNPNGNIVIDKRNGHWVFGRENQGRVDRTAIQGFVNAINDIPITKFIADAPADLSIYGLDKPTTLLSFEVSSTTSANTQPTSTQPEITPPNPQEYTLLIGAPTDLAKTSYFATWSATKPTKTSEPIKASDAVVFTITKSSADRFVKPLEDFRDPHITTVAATDVKKAVIHPKIGPAISLTRTPDGWNFTPGSGITFDADHDAVSKLIEGVIDAKAHAYQPTNKLGSQIGSLTLEVQGHSEPEVIVFYSAPAEKTKPQILAVRGRETIGYRFDASSFAVLEATTLGLRSKSVLHLDPSSIQRVVLQRSDEPPLSFETLTPAKSQTTKPAIADMKWGLKGHTVFELESFHQLLNQLTTLEASRWLDTSPDLGKSPTTASLETMDGQSFVLHINPTTGAAKLDGETIAFEITQPLRDLLRAEYLDRTVIPFTAANIERIKVSNSHAQLKEVTIVRNVANKYESEEGLPIDQSAAGALYDTIGKLRVERYLPMSEPTKDLSTSTRLTIEPKNGNPVELVITSDSKGDNRVMMSGALGNRIFRISADTLQKLTADLNPKPANSDTETTGLNYPRVGD